MRRRRCGGAPAPSWWRPRVAARVGAGLLPALATLLLGACAPTTPPFGKVLLIGIDGVRPDVLAEVSTPNLDALIDDGAFSYRARTTHPSVSGPGWSSMLIGVWPEKHGVTSNDFRGNRYDRYPDFLTRLELARPESETLAIADWLPLVSEDSGGPLVGDAVDARVVFDGYEVGWAEADRRSTEHAVAALRDGNPDALFVYLGDPDETSHAAGSIGVEYREAIALADRHVGEIVAAMRARPGFDGENWLVLVSTDHGRRPDGGHGGDSAEELTIFYIASGPAAERGAIAGPVDVVDVAVTALAHLGLQPEPEWGLDGKVAGLSSY